MSIPGGIGSSMRSPADSTDHRQPPKRKICHTNSKAEKAQEAQKRFPKGARLRRGQGAFDRKTAV
jgi:hypothetical protein